jgi:hypothetical protein
MRSRNDIAGERLLRMSRSEGSRRTVLSESAERAAADFAASVRSGEVDAR